MNDALLPWLLAILVGVAPILLIVRSRSRRNENGADTASWSAGPDGDSAGGDGGSD